MCRTSSRNPGSLPSERRDTWEGPGAQAQLWNPVTRREHFPCFRSSVPRDVRAGLQKKVSLGKQVWPWLLFLGTPCPQHSEGAGSGKTQPLSRVSKLGTPGPFLNLVSGVTCSGYFLPCWQHRIPRQVVRPCPRWEDECQRSLGFHRKQRN